MKDIWIFNHYATPPDAPGSTRHYDFARELQNRGYKVTIFAAGFSHRTRRDERLVGKRCYNRVVIGGVEFAWIKTTPYYRGNDWRRAINMLSYALYVIPVGMRFKTKPEIIWASSPHPFSGLVGYLMAKIKGAKFIFEVRDMWPQTMVDIGGYSDRSLVIRLLRILEKFLYQRANKIITLGLKASDYIIALGIPAAKIAYIPNGVEPELFAITDTVPTGEMGRTIAELRAAGRLLVGYAGAHGIANTLDTVVEAAYILQMSNDKAYFLLIGDGPEKERLISLAKSKGLSNIIFYDSIPKTAVPYFLKSIDIAVISVRRSNLYRYGTSINKLFDYMAAVRPVIWATDTPDDIVSKANCGLTVPPEDAKALAEAITALGHLSHRRRDEMGTRGYEYVMKHHSIPVLTDKLLQFLEDIEYRDKVQA
jgi:glycosyltransferase involved in cell wall biosynthesis